MDSRDWPDLLLAGPRGRRFCLTATAVNVFALRVEATEELGAGTDRAAGDTGIMWLADELPVTATTVSAVAAAVTARLPHLQRTVPTDSQVLGWLADTASDATYWQPPAEEDTLAAAAAVRDALRPVAAWVGPALAAWWNRPVARSDQHVVAWIEGRGDGAAPPALLGVADRLRAWRDAAARPSSIWWSFPPALSTSASRGDLPATQLELVEDPMGFERARVARMEPRPGCRVREVTSAADWVELVDRYPLDVTPAREDTWAEATGGHGPWLLPDWAAVSEEYDAVHLGVGAYLSAAGRALVCRDGSTVIAGWEPDVTYWLTDSLTQAEPPRTWERRRTPDGRAGGWVTA